MISSSQRYLEQLSYQSFAVPSRYACTTEWAVTAGLSDTLTAEPRQVVAYVQQMPSHGGAEWTRKNSIRTTCKRLNSSSDRSLAAYNAQLHNYQPNDQYIRFMNAFHINSGSGLSQATQSTSLPWMGPASSVLITLINMLAKSESNKYLAFLHTVLPAA